MSSTSSAAALTRPYVDWPSTQSAISLQTTCSSQTASTARSGTTRRPESYPRDGPGPVAVGATTSFVRGLQLSDAVWPEVCRPKTVLIPVGSLEQHGPHLPLDTDSAIATAVAEGAAVLLEADVQVAPVIAYGSSGEHQAFPGTMSIGGDALRHVLVELVRSMGPWATRVVFVNAHGGNVSALSSAVVQLAAEGHDVAWIPCATEDVDAHAGYTETCLMLHLRPRSVRLRLARAGNT